jgi:nitroreductase
VDGEELGVFEVMHTARAMRWLRTDPVPPELIRQILEAAVAAPNGGNRQTWGFIVVTDPTIKSDVQQYYAKAFETVSAMYSSSSPPPGMTDAQYHRQHRGVQHLTEHFHEAPVWIVACIDHGGKPNAATGASVYPAVQNILLAARALGLGATLTTRHTMYAAEVDAIFGLPEHVTALAIVPIGYPERGFSRVRRGPIEDVVYQDRWGEPYAKRAPMG